VAPFPQASARNAQLPCAIDLIEDASALLVIDPLGVYFFQRGTTMTAVSEEAVRAARSEIMPLLANIAVLIVALLHGLIGLVEMFLWKRPLVYTRLEQFGFTQSEASKVAPIVANAGLYNLFVAAGLAWSVLRSEPQSSVFFLSFVAVAGIYGAVTLKKTTLVLQTLPALLAVLAIWSGANL
jgi:putative membrane protein